MYLRLFALLFAVTYVLACSRDEVQIRVLTRGGGIQSKCQKANSSWYVWRDDHPQLKLYIEAHSGKACYHCDLHSADKRNLGRFSCTGWHDLTHVERFRYINCWEA
ncbi:uncharacterized protein VTP21DRAFT_1105 [Calcarisporiella thermophila]|uniref:uncharacterized protein n=1 Tax=Calcarisporiella thermophila TaxID=911321 RepID=UPI0037425FC5